MKKYIIILISIFLFNSSFAQEFKTEVGSSFKKENEQEVYQIVFPSAYGFMTLHHIDNVMMDNTKAMTLTKYDQAMQSIESLTFNLPKMGARAADLAKVIELEDRLIVISDAMEKRSGKHEIYAQVYSLTENTVSERKVLASFPIDGYSKSGFYNVSVSPDKSKIAVFANLPYIKKTQEKVMISVYDNSLNVLWEQSETLKYDSKRSYQENTFVLNSGDVVLNKISDAFKKTRKSELLKFNGNTVETNDFSSAGFQPMNMKLIDVNGSPMLAGFYWYGKSAVVKINPKEGNDNDGAFLYDINSKTLIGIHEWTENLDAKDLKSLEVIAIKVVNDDIFMIGEKYLENSEFRKNGSTTTTDMDYFYTYGSSVIVNFDTKGTLKGFENFMNSKKYKNDAKEKGSFATMFLNDGLRLFSNNDYIRLDSYFTEEESTFMSPSVKPNGTGSNSTPYVIPKTVREVNNYNLVYYITNYGNEYWLNKMTW
tara:strand:+ start:11602 stop:13047 length:1446 start_codon:yes stop_codon:yes gene_type:complete